MVQKIRKQGLKNGLKKDANKVLNQENLPYVLDVLQIKLISRNYNDLLADHFGINKMQKLIIQKYYRPTFWANLEIYIKCCDICLSSKAMKHKPYNDLQLLLILTQWWKDLLIDFVTGLSISTNWKRDNYNLILVIVDWLTKMINYKSIKMTIDALGLLKVIQNLVV